MKIAVLGLGYVGLPLALEFVRAGSTVVGFDVDVEKIERLRHCDGKLRLACPAEVSEAIQSLRFRITSDSSELSLADAFLICVPTPLNSDREPDLSFLTAAARSVAASLRPRRLVVLESTSYPGTTDGAVRAVLEKESGLVAGRDFHLAFSPERIDPGSSRYPLREIPKLVGGLTDRCREVAIELYRLAFQTVVPASSCRAAEAAKLLENTFRAVNIALINELKVVYAAMGVDVWEVIELASTKPFGFMPFQPGPGSGGHCIPVDPFYLSWSARRLGVETRFIDLAGQLNQAISDYVVKRVAAALETSGKMLRGSRILILGVAYKADIDDCRESPGVRIMDLLEDKEAQVSFYDPYVAIIDRENRRRGAEPLRSVCWSKETIASHDAVVIATAHSGVSYTELADWAECIVDTRNVMSTTNLDAGRLWKA